MERHVRIGLNGEPFVTGADTMIDLTGPLPGDAFQIGL
jgi:hypothetical protein